MLAASFASVLVEPLKVLSFLVHLWSASGSGYGKTVSLMLAASVWANPTPGQFIHNFSDTLVGLEKTAAFFNSLPNCIDELQTLRNKDNKNKIIYMLAQGSGRTRGTRQNTVAAAGYWHNCTLTTGEEPLTTDNGQDGSINRVLELECYSDMFDGAAARIADTVKENYGHAGKLFIENLINTDTELIKTIYEGFNRVLIADEVNSTNK